MTHAAAEEPVLSLTNISKSYRGAHALDDVEFTVYPGEVHALVGENGAGKSTLCKIIAGAVTPDEGEVRIDGKPVTFRKPNDALEAGIGMVYQETSLVPTMTVAQNIDLGREPLLARERAINLSAQQILQSMSFDVDPASYVFALGGAKKQMVEIARALRLDAKVIIFDEPTAALAPEDIMHLFDAIEMLTKQGRAVIFVSHALEEALQISDRVTVLRDGVRQICAPARELTRDDLVRHMVGRGITKEQYTRRSATTVVTQRNPVLQVENLTMGRTVKNMTFSVFPGEIVGLFGLVGSGRTETAKIVAGAMKRNRIHGGTVRLRGKPVRYRVPKQAIDDGICYVTEDRKANGFFETMGIAENIYVGKMARTPWWKRTFTTPGRMRRSAQELVEKLNIRTINTDSKVVELSGGNQQKVTIAKSLTQDPDVLLFDEPTRGVDVGAIAEIHEIIRGLAAEGKAVVLISSYLPEILTMSDRILVARQGRIAAEFDPLEVSEDQIMYASIF